MRFRKTHRAACVGIALALFGTNAEALADEWPTETAPPPHAPNVLIILTDDVGFGSTSTFGGPVQTPTFDELARDGLKYTRFHTTALCSPTRAALLTGRNPHSVEMGTLTNTPRKQAGYTTVIPKSAGTIAQILQQNGYPTAAFGKWHIVPEWETSQAGPFDRWPSGMGFGYYYGFLEGSTDQWAPSLHENNMPIRAPADKDYILDRDLADHAIKWIDQVKAAAPEKPFFIYYATGAAHSPHQAPREWLEKFRGRFDMGWDVMREQTLARQKAMGIVPQNTVLTARPDNLPAWTSLSASQKRIAARLMEAYAAALAYSDSQIGRVVQKLKDRGEFDNTLIVYIQGDNGSSAEGGPDGLLYEESFVQGQHESLDYVLENIDEIGGPRAANNYPAGWGWAMNTPFRYYKQVASYLGGTRNGMVISWPKGIAAHGEMRDQFHFVSDVAPTILETVGISPPESLHGVRQKSFDGISMAYTFDHKNLPSRRKTQAFEMMGNWGIYRDGWWAGTIPSIAPWDMLKPAGKAKERSWELFDLKSDYSQSRNLAKARPDLLKEMQQEFMTEAVRTGISLNPIPTASPDERPQPNVGRTHFEYGPGASYIPESAAPPTIGHSFVIRSVFESKEGNSDGVLIAHGGRFGGYSLFIKDGRPTFHYNSVGEHQFTIRSEKRIESGSHELIAQFKADTADRGSGGTLHLLLDGKQIGQGRIDQTLSTWISHTEGMDIGADLITPVSEEYTSQNSKFSGNIKYILFDISNPD
jgi:arylsulfatase